MNMWKVVQYVSVGDRIAYTYVKRIKRWMKCPVCHEKMTFKKDPKFWICDSCQYTIAEKEFLDDLVLWICDECNTNLNCQEGFDEHSSRHICRVCGYENDIILNNIKGICIDCGKVKRNPNATLCDGCKQIRKQKAKEWLKTTGKVVGVAAAVSAVAYLASQASDNDEKIDYTPLPNGDDERGGEMDKFPICKTCGSTMSKFDGWAWYTCPYCGDSVKIIDGTKMWCNEIFGDGNKQHRSDFELADFCRGGDLSDD